MGVTDRIHMSKSTIAILLVAVVALGAMTGVAAAEGDLDVTVEGDADGEQTVTVTENDTGVEGATVNVSVVDPANESYNGTGEYVTDANGTVVLEAADEDVTVEVTAEYENETATTTVDLEAPVDLAVDVANTDGEPLVTVTDNDTAVENASVNVSVADPANGSYAGTGEYTTDENGTVTLEAAEENVTIEVTAEYENETATTTADLTVVEDRPFGQLIRDFIDGLSDREGGIGAAVSDFVTDNNPGNAPDHAGSPGEPDDAGNATDAGNASDGAGNAPDHAGPGNESDDEQGPPDHAGPGNDDADDESDDDDEGNGGNAGAEAGNGNGQGNGPP